MKQLTGLLLMCFFLSFQSCEKSIPDNWQWEVIETYGEPTARHEAGLVSFDGKLYLLGGRRVNPTSVYDPNSNSWMDKAPPPIEIHHFQPVVFGDKIYILGAMTGGWPNERPVDKVLIYDPQSDTFEYSHTIPEHRRRGGAGVVVHDNKIYMVGGITNGHQNGYVSWMDKYDPVSGEWATLSDAPNNRDHFQAVVLNNKLYAFGGRRTSHSTGEDMDLTVAHGNIFDFNSESWTQVTQNLAIPTGRAGNGAFAWNNEIIIGGGESMAHVHAHKELEAYNSQKGTWSKWPEMKSGRHGTGFAIIDNYVYTASGCGNRGGEPELTSLERLELPKGSAPVISSEVSESRVHQQWHTLTIPFEGPQTSEDAEDNPFLNYSLIVSFSHQNGSKNVRGFYAADGNPAETSAKEGNQWHVRFTPYLTGNWTYRAILYHGDSVAIKDELEDHQIVKLSDSEGGFYVIPSDKEGNDFRAHGRLIAKNGFFSFEDTDEHWLKAGANSPENFLAYSDFDDTYRMKAEAREGEAAAPETIHTFEPHLSDWRSGDPTWKNGKGKSIIGAVNYLAEKGMNSCYFLTMNILGDGKDVWPYVNPDDQSRFDVSKLDQWEMLFQHMQSKGILLHIVTQETENETMLDEGNTGPMRKLYYRELISRFGHHLGLIWNLGEENGPASWSPIGQNDAQRKAMAAYLKKSDPYNHPVLLHTHSYDPVREDILNDILEYKYVDGLSFQQNHREEVSDQIKKWRDKSISSGHEWLISMDEIGEWHTAVKTDSEDPEHPSIRRFALWGSLMSGAAGVEWYFGARHPHNDLTSEDWRQRDRLWDLTNYAREFFKNFLPYWEMQVDHEMVKMKNAYCLKKPNEIYAIYIPRTKTFEIDLSEAEGTFVVEWYNPLYGGPLQKGSVETVSGGGIRTIGNSPSTEVRTSDQDWAILLRKKAETH